MMRPDRHAAVGYAFSATLHSGLMLCIFWWGTPAWMQKAAINSAVQTIVASQADSPPEETAAWEVAAADPETLASESQEDGRTSPESPLSATAPGLAEFARKRLDQARHEVEDDSPEEQRDDLESLARRLEQVSNEQSVEELSGTLSKWLGANERKVPSAEDADREDADREGTDFDVGTAQISDVKRITTEDGVIYIAVLVDSQGNSIETPLDDVDGPQLYETFQLIKRFPLLASVYRKIVMGLLDKLVADTQQTDASKRQPQPKPGQQQQQ